MRPCCSLPPFSDRCPPRAAWLLRSSSRPPWRRPCRGVPGCSPPGSGRRRAPGGGDQVRERRDQRAFDGPLQVPRAVLQVGAFAKQVVLARSRSARRRKPVGSEPEDALLHVVQFEVEDPAQLGLAERPEDHHLVDAVHELRRELAARGLHAGARDLVRQLRVRARRPCACARLRRRRSPASAAASIPSRPRPGCWS